MFMASPQKCMSILQVYKASPQLMWLSSSVYGSSLVDMAISWVFISIPRLLWLAPSVHI